MHKIIIIGAGQIGSRHLQALALATEPFHVTVVEPSSDSLRIAQSRLEEISTSLIQVVFVSKLPINKKYDLAIIATSAMDRFDVFCQLVESNNVHSIIFEKVLFQTVAHIDQAEMLLKQYDIKAWVNCARRANLGYRKLRQVIDTTSPIVMKVSGNNYGLACNGIHFLDLFAFLINQPDIEKLDYQLDSEYVQTKRTGCYEIFGCLTAMAGENRLKIDCSNQSEEITVQVEIRSNDRVFVIDEVNQHMTESMLDGTVINEMEFVLQPQSKMTHIVAVDILSSGHCTLPPYSESAALHRHYLRAFEHYFNLVSPGKFSVCPIS